METKKSMSPEMRERLIQNLSKVDRKVQAEASRRAGLLQVAQKKGIHADGMQELARKAHRKWVKENYDKVIEQVKYAQSCMTEEDILRMASSKTKWLPIGPDGFVYSSIAHAVSITGYKNYNIENWSKREHYGWRRVLKEDYMEGIKNVQNRSKR